MDGLQSCDFLGETKNKLVATEQKRPMCVDNTAVSSRFPRIVIISCLVWFNFLLSLSNIFLSYFSVDFRLKIFLNYSTYSTAHEIPTLECIGVSIASVLCLDWSVLLLSERNNLSTYKYIIVLWFTDFQHKKFRPTQNLSLGLLLIVFLKFS